MRKLCLLLITVVCSLASLANTNLVAQEKTDSDIYHDSWIDRNKNGKQDPYENPELPVEERVADLIGQMNIDEKTAQMGTIYGYKRILKDPRPTEKWKTRVWKDGIGNIDEHCNGVRGFHDNVELATHCDILNEIQRWFIEETRLGVPVDFTNEGIRGVCHSDACNFPTQLGVGATWDKGLVRRIGEITAIEGKALGYSNIYSPILDVVRDPRWGRTIECYGESPFHVGEMGIQQCLGIQSKGVASTVKHFATYSTPNGGRDGKGRTDPQIPRRDMYEILMLPFEKVITEAKPLGAMSSYNTYDGVPVTGSKYFLTDLLRGEYGFEGYVVSDSGAVDRLKSQHKTAKDWKTAIVHAVTAGLNVRTNFQKTEKFVLPLRELIAEGRLSEELIDSRVADVLRVKFKLGLFDKPFADGDKVAEIVHNPEHEKVTLEAARKAMVLLKNDGTLPLDGKAYANVLVTGPLADDPLPMISRYGPGRSDVITPLAGIKEFLGDGVKVTHAKGCHYFDKLFPESDIIHRLPNDEAQAEIDEAVALGKQADLIIACVGDTHDTVGESKSRVSLNLPGHQDLLVQELAKTGKPVIVVLMPGRATSINWIQQNIPGIVCAWHGGEKVGQAIAETLFGANNPAGKLPITFPKSVGQIPLATPSRNGAHGGQSKGHDPNGWGTSRVRGPLYPLGHGLSYTKFDYKNLKITPAAPTAEDKITITCDVTNAGDRDSDNVVQLYIRDVVGTITPFTKMLRGFERVAIAAGETKTVTFELNPLLDLKTMGPEHTWIVEPGVFEVMIAESSSDEAVKQQGSFTLK